MSQRCYQVALPHESVITKYFARCHLVSFYIITERLVRKWWWAKSTTPTFLYFFLAHLSGKHLYSSLLLLITSKYTQRVEILKPGIAPDVHHTTWFLISERQGPLMATRRTLFFALTEDFEGDFRKTTWPLHLFALHLKIKLNNCSDNLCN